MHTLYFLSSVFNVLSLVRSFCSILTDLPIPGRLRTAWPTVLTFVISLVLCNSCTQTDAQHTYEHHAHTGHTYVGQHDSTRYLLGKYLFFDQRLSATGAKSCASCHNPELAFTDGYRRSPGIFADLHFRNTPTLLNVSRQEFLNWANTDITSVSRQMENPLFGTKPIEMGLSAHDNGVLRILEKDKIYSRLLSHAGSHRKTELNWETVMNALAVYVNSLNSFASPYDRYKAGDTRAITASAKAGEHLFFSSRLQCATCHQPPVFGADSTMSAEKQFANIGLYNFKNGNYPFTDQGLFTVTRKEGDRGKFKTPTLRNLQYTAPYFHDGSAETLDDALAVFEEGGRDITYGEWQGDGRKNPHKSPLIKKTLMTAVEKQNLLDFLQSLNDTTITRFQSPL